MTSESPPRCIWRDCEQVATVQVCALGSRVDIPCHAMCCDEHVALVVAIWKSKGFREIGSFPLPKHDRFLPSHDWELDPTVSADCGSAGSIGGMTRLHIYQLLEVVKNEEDGDLLHPSPPLYMSAHTALQAARLRNHDPKGRSQWVVIELVVNTFSLDECNQEPEE